MKYIYLTMLFFGVFLVPDVSTASFEAESKYCVDRQGKFEVRFASNFDDEGYAVCVFKDGSECIVDNYMNDTCAPGQSLLPDLGMEQRSAGWVVDKNHPKNNYDYTDKNNSQFFYYEVAVRNQNSNTGSFSSDPTTLIVYSDPVEKIDIPALKPGESTKIFNVYIPTEKVQSVDLEVNPDKIVREKDYTNNTLYDRPSKTIQDSSKISMETPETPLTLWERFLVFLKKFAL